MRDNKGIGKISLVLVTIILTILFCYVALKLATMVAILRGDFSQSTQDDSYAARTDLSKVYRVKKMIDQYFLNEYSGEKLIDGAIAGMLEALDDPYTTYYNKTAYESFATKTEGEYVGIGISVIYDSERKMPVVVTPMPESPALEVGILTGDYIEYVDNFQFNEKTYEELVDAIKGIAGTKVKIGIRRYTDHTFEKYERKEFLVERRKIEINPIIEKVYEGDIGYIRMTSFDEVSYEEFKTKYYDLLNNKKVKSLILDLRNNPGGILQTCAQITDLLVPEGKIVYTVDKNGKEEVLKSDANQITIPFVILVNESSASASEVLTAAVKDYGVGTIIGTKTFGKGVVQSLKPIGDGTYIKMTTSEYFSPKGNKIHGLGIEPDIHVELPEDVEDYYEIELEDDTQLQRAIEELKKKSK